MMDVTVEDKIRQRAYEIWMSAGTAARDPAADWLEAERAIMRETAMPVAKRTATKSSATKTSATKRASGATPAPKARAATASAAKPASVRKRAKTQA